MKKECMNLSMITFYKIQKIIFNLTLWRLMTLFLEYLTHYTYFVNY